MQHSIQGGRHSQPRPQQYGHLVRQRRQERGWSQADLAKKIGIITRAQVSRIETGANQPSPLVLDKIGELLDIPVEDSYALTGYMPCSELPGLRAYLIAKHRDWPMAVIDELERFCDYLKNRHRLSD